MEVIIENWARRGETKIGQASHGDDVCVLEAEICVSS